MEHHTSTSRAEAERLLGIAEKLLRNRDFASSRDFAVLAQETEPLLDGSDQILAVTDVLLAADKRINNHHDWYAILQVSHRTEDLELIKRQYRRLALLLHPDKNKFPFSDSAFRLVADAWAVLSDTGKKAIFDNEISLYTKVDLVAAKKSGQRQPADASRQQAEDPSHQKLPVRRSSRGSHTGGQQSMNPNASAGRNVNREGGRGSRGRRTINFWTACPYCYNLHQYARTYEGCCLRCQNCRRAFTAVEISTMPPVVPGKDAYYFCWGFFPMGFVTGNLEGGKAAGADRFPNWMPPMFSAPAPTESPGVRAPAPPPATGGGGSSGARFPNVRRGSASATPGQSTQRKRGRPRKNVF